MKRFYLLAMILAAATFAQAQALIVTPSSSLTGNLEDDETIELYIYLQNVTGGTATLEWIRTSSYLHPGWEYSICDNYLCYYSDYPGATMSPVQDSAMAFMKASVVAHAGETGSGYVNYSVWVQGDSAGSVVELSFQFNVVTDVDGSQFANVVTVFPNPVRDRLYMQATNGTLGKGSIRIFDLNGALLRDVPVAGVQSADLDVSTLPAGTYLMRYETGSTVITRKFNKH